MSQNLEYAMLNDPEMKEIVESFLIETKEIVEKLDVDLMELEKSPEDKELLNQIFRSFHTIKGTSGFLGLDKLTKVTHKCEDILNKLRKGEAVLSSGLMDGILLAFDTIKELASSIENNKNEDVDIANTIEVLTKLIDMLNSGETITPSNNEPKTTDVKSESGSGEAEQVETNNDGEKPQTIQPAAAVEEKPSKQNGVSDALKNALGKKSDSTIRVDVERLDELLNIVSELVLGRNRLAQVNSEFSLEYEGTKFSRDLADATKQIDIMTNELQLVVMKTRMVKIGKVFNRFPRLVRDLSKETGKEINLIIKGEETELDKTLIEEINDPLVHLIRNSVDHGVEAPEKRKQIGKDPTGSVILSAEQEGNNIIISIEDDGKGIDPEILKEKALSKGLITKEKAKDLSKQDCFNLIFLPGFSTAEVVTNVSGRGVGMDVVKTNVTKLRGIISIDSVVGKGTKIVIKLPLTLAIIPGMIVRIRSEFLVIPLNSIIEVVRVHTDNINTINQKEVIRIRDSVLPLISIDELLMKNYQKDDNKVWQYVAVIGIAEKRFGIKVDELMGQKEVVIKSLGSYLGNVEGIAGSTIMGDGTVVMILDIGELVNKLAV